MPTKEEEANELAQRHYQVETGLTGVYRIIGPTDAELRSNEPIKLLEVNQNTVPSGIIPLQFGPSPASGIHFPSVILEVTPEEYAMIRTNELKLPQGWRIGEMIPRLPYSEEP